MNGRWLAGKVAAALLTLVFVLVFNFFLFRVMGDPTTQLARLPNATAGGDRAAPGRLRARQAARPASSSTTSATRVRLDLGISQRSREPVWERDQGRAAVDAAAGRHRHAARDADRQLAGGGRRDPARQEDRRRAARLQPVHLRGARVLDRDHPDPRLRGLDTDPPGRPAGDARGRVLELVRGGARRRRAPDPAGDRDDPDAARPVLPDHALVDGRRADRGLHHRQARDRAAVASGWSAATRSRTRCCRW